MYVNIFTLGSLNILVLLPSYWNVKWQILSLIVWLKIPSIFVLRNSLSRLFN